MDPITASTLAAGGISLAGGLASNWLAGAESKRARQFSERMAGTAWQRAVVDMRAAGVNPAVAYSRGPAAMPSAPTASFDNPAAGAVSSAIQAAGMRKNLELLDAQIAKTRSEGDSARVDAVIKHREGLMDAQKWSYYMNNDGTAKAPLAALMEAEFQSNVANSARSISEAQLAKFSVPERQAIAKLFEQVGSSGKAFQMLLPLLMNMSQGYARGRY